MCARWWIRFIVVACARRIAGGIDESFPSTNSFVGQSFGQHDQRSKEEMALHAESERLWPVHGGQLEEKILEADLPPELIFEEWEGVSLR